MISLNIFSNFNINNCVIFKMTALKNTLKDSDFCRTMRTVAVVFHFVTVSLFLKSFLMVLGIQ